MMLGKLPTMDEQIERISTSMSTKKGPKKRKARDAGDVLARKRAQQFRKRDSNSRHFTGIVNQAMKNRQTNAEKLLDKNQKLAEMRILRIKSQLRDELYEMQVSKRALRGHSLVAFEPESKDERSVIEKFSARGRYLYAVRKEKKAQKDIMDAFNERMEIAQKLLRPARRESVAAMDLGRNMGSNSPTKYYKIGRRISHIGQLPPLQEDSDDDSEIERELKTIAESKKMARPPKPETVESSPKPDIVQIRSELCPELQMALDRLELEELSHIGSSPWLAQSRISAVPSTADGEPASTERVQKQIQDKTALPIVQEKSSTDKKGRLTLPPVQMGRNAVVCKITKHERKLSSVAEN